MTREEIAALAVEAGFSKYQIGGMFDVYLEQFAELVAYREREARKAAQQETIALREELTKRAIQAEKDAYQRGVRDEREECAVICDELGQHWSDYKDTALLNGDFDLSNAASGEPRAATAIAEAIRKRTKC